MTRLLTSVSALAPRTLAFALVAVLTAGAFLAVVPTAAAAPVPVDLCTWSKEGVSGNGDWRVLKTADPDSTADCAGGDFGVAVKQFINGNPTFFLGPGNVIDQVIRGTFEVETTSDDDLIGFVMGYQHPLGADDPRLYDTIVFSWKQGTQFHAGTTSYEGFGLHWVQAADPMSSAEEWDCFWGRAKQFDSCPTAENTKLGALVDSSDADDPNPTANDDLGWHDNTEYEFELTYASDRILIRIKGGQFADWTTIFDVAGTFPAGRFGFFNLSQSHVEYAGFTEADFPTAAVSPVSIDVSERGCFASFDVTLSEAWPDPVSVDVDTADSTATAGSDYTALSTTANFAPGETSKSFQVPIIADRLVEGTETFHIGLSNPSNAVLGSDGVVNILDGDTFDGQFFHLTDTATTLPGANFLMERETFPSPAGDVVISPGGTALWASDEAAGAATDFGVDSFFDVCFELTLGSAGADVSIGHLDPADGTFTPFATSNVPGPIPTEIVALSLQASGPSVVPGGHHIAVQVVDLGGGATVGTQGNSPSPSFLMTPASSPEFPTPEWTTLAFFAVGLLAMGWAGVLTRRD